MNLCLRTTLVACLFFGGCASPSAVGAKGWELLENRNYPAALQEFEQALQTSREAELLAGQGQSLYMLGRASQARTCFDEACHLDPSNPRWQVGLAVVLLSLGEDTAAVSACDAALELDPQHPGALYNRGCAHLRESRFELALADFTESLRSDPSCAEAFDNRGSALAGLGRLDEAVEDFRQATRLAPLAGAHSNCAAACHALGDSRQALAELNQALRIDSSRPAFFANRGRIYMDLAQAELALADFEQALALAPTSGEYQALFNEALVCTRAAQTPHADNQAHGLEAAAVIEGGRP